MEFAATIISYVLATVFLLAGGAKLAGVQMMKDNFIKYGFPEWFVLVVGAGEVVGGIVLVIPGIAILAATGLSILMVGAAVTHFKSKEAPMVIPAAVLLILAIFVGFQRADDFARFVIGA